MAEPNLHKLCILTLFPMQDFNGLLVCYSWGLPATYPAEKHSVAICLRSSHNLTGLYGIYIYINNNNKKEEYLMMHSTNFIYGYMVLF